MTRDIWLLTILALLGAYNAGVLWLAQISGYPLWRLVGQGNFPDYYATWSVSAVVLISAPMLLSLAASATALWTRPAGISDRTLWVEFMLQLVAVALTMPWLAPAAKHLITVDGSLNPRAFAGFLRLSWVRVVLITFYACLCWQMLGSTLWPSEPGPAQVKGWLLLLTVACGVVSTAQVWMVQTLAYKVWPNVGTSAFYDYHLAWWHSIWISIFIPAGATLIGVVALLWWHPAHTDMRLVWAAVALQILLGVTTAMWWGPLMARLATRAEGLLMDRYRLLMSTHWWRVAIVTGYGMVILWMLVHASTEAGRSLTDGG